MTLKDFKVGEKGKIIPKIQMDAVPRKAFIALLVIYVLALYPIIRANFHYIDDLGRTVWGYTGFVNPYSRYAAEYLSKIIHADYYLSNISPLPQLLAAVFLTCASLIVLHVFADGKKINAFAIIAVLPLGLSPYFLECLSYQYDSPYMALSILASVLPFLWWGASTGIYAAVSAVCAVLICTTYQSACGIYPMIAIFLCCRSLRKDSIKQPLKKLFVSAGSYLAGFLFFKVVFMSSVDSYVSTSFFSVRELIPGFLRNLKQYYQLVVTDLKKEWLLFFAVICVVFLYTQLRERRFGNAFFSVLAAAVSLVLCAVLAFGMYPALANPLYEPRGMIGFGAFMSLVAVQVAYEKKWLGNAACLCLSWCFLVFSFTYGNALSEQKEWMEYRTQLVAADLSRLDIMQSDTTVHVQITGSAGDAPAITGIPRNYRILNRLIPDVFTGGWWWGQAYFFTYLGLENITSSSEDLTKLELPVVAETTYHIIRADSSNILIELR